MQRLSTICSCFIINFIFEPRFLSSPRVGDKEEKKKERRLHLGVQAVTSAVHTGCSQSASLSHSSAKSSQDEAGFLRVECRLLIRHILMSCVVQVHSHYGLGGHRY